MTNLNMIFHVVVSVYRLVKIWNSPQFPDEFRNGQYKTRGPFLERPGKLTGPVSYFEIKVSRKLGCVLASNEVQFASLPKNFTV